ncbi:hypothetical protein [Agrococcus carbonis]|uniref:Uncharacterized protein n=1 Tax=Agrococcus carbonis TaxID=684552 RepID=A0A1H1QJ45_9MICO|nr:hypothetical protein [Agrococcus carbonis]SDS22929.1 hypothetical protein SAMN04489719_1840 [Agrococcus carbonis]
MARSADARGRWVARLDAVGIAAAGLGILTLLGYLVGGLVLTGGRMAEDLGYLYGHIVEWPLFVVEPWLPIAVSSVTLLAFVPMAALVRPEETGRLTRAINLVAAGSICLPFAMMLLFPTVVSTDHRGVDETVPGDHWIGLAIGIATMVLMIALGARAMTEQGRRMRA